MSHRALQDIPIFEAQPTTPSPMVGHRGGPPGAPPMPWRKYVFFLLGFPVRMPKATDHWRPPPR